MGRNPRCLICNFSPLLFPIFLGPDILVKPSEEEEESGSEASEVDDEGLEDAASDDEEEEQAPARPYMALMQKFSSESSAPSAKRRKVMHQQASASEDEVTTVEKEAQQEGEEEEEGDDKGSDNDEDADEADEAGDAEAAGPEEQPENDDSEDEIDDTDPFDSHFAAPNEQKSAKAIAKAKEGEWTTKRTMMQPWRTTVMLPGAEGTLPQPVSGLEGLKLKRKLRESSTHKVGALDAGQRSLAGALFDYRDVMLCDRTVDKSNKMRQTVCLHALNHVFKTRDRVIKNNYKLSKAGEDAELELRDQGFTRPKVLFLLPTRDSCAKMMQVIQDLVEPDQQENIKRFNESFVDNEQAFGEDRPADFKDLFGGNDDDMFRIGIKFTRKTIKYFSPFYSSDILLASPLGLRMAIGSEEEKKKVDYDFLSSIEVVVVDQADALLMQNWEHVEYIFEHLNLQPKDAHDCDFSRVRNWYLEDWAKHFRQTVILSAFNTPELAELQRLHCHNWAGRLRFQPEYPGVIGQLGVKAKQTFSRFVSGTVDKDPEARFDYFTSAIVPSLTKRSKDAAGTLIFVPSYLDFVRVRNWFATADAVSSITFGVISEYTEVRDASRARSYFLTGRHKVLLYTERAHHFRRYQFSGVQRVIFYGLPDNPVFYREIAGGYLARSERELKVEPGQGTVRAMFSKYDVMKLERIAGSKRVGKMIQDTGDTFDFL
ncbi:U3 small nucleolar RNA-associated protein 25 [Escovopsis weberi]|uniref:U3 small nucleolar RNA-associated protein 25 n=1 Tax=Escovopsis weberi TaxID=150374 RepID=A0A0M8N407_ESCWE|nr:U3 small nucleolar RNA-associated protein 25 [Escovopsis weberi]